MPAEWHSNLGAFIGATERQVRVGLVTVAELYMADVKPPLQEGYKSGKFVTGNMANSVARGDPEASGDGFEIAVGSTQTDPPYGLYWELGFHSVFTKQHERKEIWVPTMVDNRDKYVNALAAEIRAVDGTL